MKRKAAETTKIEKLSRTAVLVNGRLRLEALATHLLRIEEADSDGSFCDRETFLVKNRGYAGVPLEAGDGDPALLHTAEYSLRLPEHFTTAGEFAAGIEVWTGAERQSAAGSLPLGAFIHRGLASFSFPPPASRPLLWTVNDSPRAVHDGSLSSGWTVNESLLDLYVFFPGGDRPFLRKAFLELTGPVPLPPLWTFGFWTSRYFPYTEKSALETIDRYREHGIPLDVFVVDTDWRKGGSRGYDIDTTYFPDMAHFFGKAHERSVKVIFNDHPEPRGMQPLDPALYRYRAENLTRLIDMGLDTWWFDRNWGDIIPGPVPGLETAVWGQQLYYEIIGRHEPEKRTVILSMRTSHPAGHRYPLWWTGDIPSEWESLTEAVRETLEDGEELRPYTSQDIGGHIGFPSPEQYLRWIQWGTFSPTMRVHSGPKNRFRYPWRYGKTVLELSRRFITLRYRLLPLLYREARRAYDEGTAILRTTGEEYPGIPAEYAYSQFTIGGSLLVAPVTVPSEESALRHVPFAPEGGFTRTVYAGNEPEGDALPVGWDRRIRLNASNSSEAQMAWGRNFTVVWEGSFVPEEDGWYLFHLNGNGRKELEIGEPDFPQIMRAFDRGSNEATVFLEGGKSCRLKVLYASGGEGFIDCLFSCEKLRKLEQLPPVARKLYLPPGRWRNLLTGESVEGPGEFTVPARTPTVPLFVREGSLIPLAPPMRYTGEKPWNPLTLEIFPHPADGTFTSELYEDDGESYAYMRGGFSFTGFTLSRAGSRLRLDIGRPESGGKRSWILRFHLGPGQRVREVKLNGAEIDYRELNPPKKNDPFAVPFIGNEAFSGNENEPLFPNGKTVMVELETRDAVSVELLTEP